MNETRRPGTAWRDQGRIVDQEHATEHFAERHRPLLAIGNAGVGRALRMEPEKVTVLRYDDTSRGGGELDVRHVRRTDQTGIRRSGDVDVATP